MRSVAGGFFPLDERWGLSDSVYSSGVAKQIVWLSGQMPYEKVVQAFERIGHCSIPRASVWRESRKHGERLRAHLEREQARVKPERVVLPPPGRDHRRRKGISIDGGKVHIREEGWKEFKVGTVFDVQRRRQRDPLTGEWQLGPHGVKMDYAAVLGTPQAFGPALWALAVKKEVPQAVESSVTADGAEWIWNLAADCFPDSVQIVDWYHACEHLAQAGAALYPQDAHKAEAWFKQQRHHLYLGEIQAITQPLDRAGHSEQSQYFHTHHRRMRYQEFREEGYPIGSGTVESAIKQFKARLSGPGMRWSRPGAERMLAVRASVMGDRFDNLWAAA